jgi:ATP-dependent helicase HrpB
MTEESLVWDGLVVFSSDPDRTASTEASRVLGEAALAAGASAFSDGDALEAWLGRTRFAASMDESIRAPDEAAVRAAILQMCVGRCGFDELREARLLDVLRRQSGAPQGAVEKLAPERVMLASGRSVAVRYEPERPPRIASRLQDFFGMVDGPRIGQGKVPVVIELLAPNGRAVQVTSDLRGFWERHYPSIRNELRRRYPKHAWPDDPTKALPRMPAKKPRAT